MSVYSAEGAGTLALPARCVRNDLNLAAALTFDCLRLTNTCLVQEEGESLMAVAILVFIRESVSVCYFFCVASEFVIHDFLSS